MNIIKMSIDLLHECFKIHDIREISKILNIVPGTINRWIQSNSVPSQYEFDLLKILGKNIEYEKYSPKSKDQFFTPHELSKKCFDTFLKVSKINIDNYIFIEPSAGGGSFFNILPENKIGLDIEPRCEKVLKHDYLSWKPKDVSKKYIVIGNPPFGLRGHVALHFINHSYSFADYVAFILPQLFESDGKGSPRKRVQGYNLIFSEKITDFFNTPDNENIKINGVFQIWSKYTQNEEYDIQINDNSIMDIYSISDGDNISKRRNVDKIGKCHVYLHSTCFGNDKMRAYSSFDELIGKRGYGIIFKKDIEKMKEKAFSIDWTKECFKSTNSALNLRTSLIYNCLI